MTHQSSSFSDAETRDRFQRGVQQGLSIFYAMRLIDDQHFPGEFLEECCIFDDVLVGREENIKLRFFDRFCQFISVVFRTGEYVDRQFWGKSEGNESSRWTPLEPMSYCASSRVQFCKTDKGLMTRQGVCFLTLQTYNKTAMV